MQGAYCTVEPFDIDAHLPDLFEALSAVEPDWTYLPYGPFDDIAAFREWAQARCLGDDPLFYTVRDNETGKAGGVASYLRITPDSGTIEVGAYPPRPRAQRQPSGDRGDVPDDGVRLFARVPALRVEVQRAERAPRETQRSGWGSYSRARGGRATVNKGRNRDSDWFSIIDADWPRLREGFRRWLDPGNFDGNGRQRHRLQECVGGEGAGIPHPRAPTRDAPTPGRAIPAPAPPSQYPYPRAHHRTGHPRGMPLHQAGDPAPRHPPQYPHPNPLPL